MELVGETALGDSYSALREDLPFRIQNAVMAFLITQINSYGACAVVVNFLFTVFPLLCHFELLLFFKAGLLFAPSSA